MISDVIKIARLHLERLNAFSDEIRSLGDLQHIDVKSGENLKIIDAFLFRFIKYQDYVGNKLFKIFLSRIGEYSPDMSLLDQLDRLEKLGLLDSVDSWMNIRRLSNALTHDYPDNEDLTKEDLIVALEFVPFFNRLQNHLEDYLLAKGIINNKEF